MPGKFAPRSWDERVAATLRADTTRTVGGQGRNAGPSVSRSRVAASRRGASTGLSTTALKFTIDKFLVTDTTTDTFTLDFMPVPGSWNVHCGYPLDDDDYDDTIDGQYSVTGRTVTILDPATTFIGASSTFPKVLHVEYAYLVGIPTAPAGPAPAFVGISTVAGTASTSHAAPTGLVGGETLLYAVMQLTSSGAPATPTGWSPVTNKASGFATMYLFSRVATGTSADDITTRAGRASIMVAISESTIATTTTAAATSPGSTWALPTATVDAGDLVLHFMGGSTGVTGIAFSGDYITPDAAELTPKVPDGADEGMGAGSFTAAAAGTSATQTWHVASPDSVMAITAVLRGV